VGTATPAAKLDVAGTVRAAGIAFADGTAQDTARLIFSTGRTVVDLTSPRMTGQAMYFSKTCPVGYTAIGGAWDNNRSPDLRTMTGRSGWVSEFMSELSGRNYRVGLVENDGGNVIFIELRVVCARDSMVVVVNE